MAATASPPVAASRSTSARYPRHPIHGDLLTGDEWERWRHAARPLQLGQVLRVDTTRPADPRAIITWIQAPRGPAHPARA